VLTLSPWSFTASFEQEWWCPSLPLSSQSFWLSHLKMAHGNDRENRPQSEGSNRGCQSSPPHQMVMTVGTHWGSMVNRYGFIHL
jgi:hypothetical protein